MRPGTHVGTVEQSKSALSHNKIEIDFKEKRVGTLRSQVCLLKWPADEVVHGGMIIT